MPKQLKNESIVQDDDLGSATRHPSCLVQLLKVLESLALHVLLTNECWKPGMKHLTPENVSAIPNSEVATIGDVYCIMSMEIQSGPPVSGCTSEVAPIGRWPLIEVPLYHDIPGLFWSSLVPRLSVRGWSGRLFEP